MIKSVPNVHSKKKKSVPNGCKMLVSCYDHPWYDIDVKSSLLYREASREMMTKGRRKAGDNTTRTEKEKCTLNIYKTKYLEEIIFSLNLKWTGLVLFV